MIFKIFQNKYKKSVNRLTMCKKWLSTICKKESYKSQHVKNLELKILELKYERHKKKLQNIDDTKYVMELEYKRRSENDIQKLEMYKNHLTEISELYEYYLQRRSTDHTKSDKPKLTLSPFLLSSTELQVYGTKIMPLFSIKDLKITLYSILPSTIYKTCIDVMEDISIVENHVDKEFISCFNAKHILEIFMQELDTISDLDVKIEQCNFNQHFAIYQQTKINDIDFTKNMCWGVRLPLNYLPHKDKEDEIFLNEEYIHYNTFVSIPNKIQSLKYNIYNHMNSVNNYDAKQIIQLKVRIDIVFDRIHKYDLYVPDVLERYLQDQEAHKEKLIRKTIASRRDTWLFKVGMEEAYVCECCTTPLSFDDYERGHIVPSRNNTCGSNGCHNIMILCSNCNKKMTDMDAILYKDTIDRLNIPI